MTRPYIVILMGSKSDLEHSQKIASEAKLLGIEAKMHIGSAHKTASYVLAILKDYEEDRTPKVYITVAGRSNALSGFTDGFVTAPVIACPPASSSFGGADLFSSLRMPSGVAPGLVLEPANAALFAAKILALQDKTILEKVKDYQNKQREKIYSDNQSIQAE